MKTKKSNRQTGITLIALVITIIVLLILAGVSIAMLTGENGLLTKAKSASEQTKQQGAIEKVEMEVIASYEKNGLDIKKLQENLKNVEGIDTSTIKDYLPMTVKVDDILINIYDNGKVEIITDRLPSTDNTIPYLPSSDFGQVEQTNLDTGLVIKDKEENSYVWIEVPKNIFTTASSNTEYSNIEKDMQTYAADYREDKDGNTGTDTWYDGCGIETEEDYNNLKNKMLKSVYTNGGFWISQYEMGTDTIRKTKDDELTVAFSKEGQYPYNWVIVKQAQQLSNQMNSGNYNSSLMFGIQWDLMLKFLEVKGMKTQNELKIDSGQWGNHLGKTFDIAKGKYSVDDGKTYVEVTGTYSKPESRVLLTTGATQRNSILNIYDISGNVWEWTLEKSMNSNKQANRRGGDYYSYSSSISAAGRLSTAIDDVFSTIGFRTVIF